MAAPTIAVADRMHPTPELCTIHQVVPGESITAIALAAGRNPLEVAQINPHITNWDLIYPGDQIALDCRPAPVAAEVPPVESQSMPIDGAELPLPPALPTLDRMAINGALTPQAVVAVLYDAGFRGNALITMAAVCQAESAAKPDAVGDEHLTDDKWGPSYGLCQIRSLHAERGTGSTRDGEALVDPVFNGWAAYAISGSGTNFDPWTCFRTAWWLEHVETMRAAATELGLLEGQ